MIPVICEGPDGAGKSFLAHKLALCFNGVYEHNGPDQGVTPADLYAKYARQILTPGGLFIDRSWLSENIYGKAFRGSSRLSPSDIASLYYALTRLNGAIVLCLPPLDTCWTEIQRRGEHLSTDMDTFRQVYLAYHNISTAADSIGTSVYIYNWKQDPTAEGLIAWLEARRKAAK